MISQNKIEDILREADYIIETGCTVRQCGKFLGTSKSTVYNDVAHILEGIDSSRHSEVKKVLSKNKAERARRGGMSRGKQIHDERSAKK